jgi:hypothetical protein
MRGLKLRGCRRRGDAHVTQPIPRFSSFNTLIARRFSGNRPAKLHQCPCTVHLFLEFGAVAVDSDLYRLCPLSERRDNIWASGNLWARVPIRRSTFPHINIHINSLLNVARQLHVVRQLQIGEVIFSDLHTLRSLGE